VDDFLDQIGGEGQAADDIDKKLASSGPITPGFYRATLDGAKMFESANTGSKAHELTFKIKGGPFDGREVTDKIWLPKAEDLEATDDKTVKKVGNLRARLAKAGLCLGLVTKDPKGRLVRVEGKTDFVDVLDTECIVEVTMEPDQQNPDKKWPRIAFNGFFSKDDKEAAAKIGKGKPAAAPPRGGSGTPARGEEKKPAPSVKGRI